MLQVWSMLAGILAAIGVAVTGFFHRGIRLPIAQRQCPLDADHRPRAADNLSRIFADVQKNARVRSRVEVEEYRTAR